MDALFIRLGYVGLEVWRKTVTVGMELVCSYVGGGYVDYSGIS